MCIWLRVEFKYGPLNRSRAQGAAECFTPLQLDTLHALSNLNAPSSGAAHRIPPRKSKREMSTRKVLKIYPIGTKVFNIFSMVGKEDRMKGQALWRIHCEDNNWEEYDKTGGAETFRKPVKRS